MKVSDIIPVIYPYDKDFYIMPNGNLEGYPTFTPLAKTIDTVRQFYDCLLKREVLEDCEKRISGLTEEIGYDEFKLTYLFTRTSKSSGYQYSLQSKKIGLQALFKRSHLKATQDSSQVKLEISPEFLILPTAAQERYISNLMNYLTVIRKGKADYDPVHFAIHFALDFQIHEEDLNYVDDVFPNFTNQIKGFRGQKCYKNKSLAYEIKDLELAVNGYKGAETITIGSPSAMQFTIYRKDLEIIKTNKVDFFTDIWGDKYNSDFPVFRLELRLHQDQLKEYRHNTGTYYIDYIKSKNWDLVYRFLTNRIRYMDETKTVLSPIWLKILDSISHCGHVEKIKPKKDPLKVDKNLSHILGNTVSMLFKVGLDASEAYLEVLSMLEQRIFKSAFTAHFNILPDDPYLDLKLKEKLSDYIIEKYEAFKVEYLI